MASIIYVLTNPAMPGLVKIGKTTRNDPQVRMNELYTSSSGVPLPFDCAKAVQVEDERAAEKALHEAFAPYRINPKREFFKIEEYQATALLELIGMEDVTPEIRAENNTIDKLSREAAEQYSRRRPNLNFEEMSIPVGARLSAVNYDKTVQVSGARKVIYEGEEMSLTNATRIIMELDYSIQPTPHWRYEGELLSDIYNRTY